MHRLKVAGHRMPHCLMVVGDFNIMNTVSVETETYAPLVVDTDAPLHRSLARKGFKTIGGRQAQIVNFYGRIQLGKPHKYSLLNVV